MKIRLKGVTSPKIGVLLYFRYLVGQKLVNYEHGKRLTKPAPRPTVDAE